MLDLDKGICLDCGIRIENAFNCEKCRYPSADKDESIIIQLSDRISCLERTVVDLQNEILPSSCNSDEEDELKRIKFELLSLIGISAEYIKCGKIGYAVSLLEHAKCIMSDKG